MKNKLEINSSNIKYLAKPLSLLLGSIVFLIFVFMVGLGQFNSTRSKYDKVKKEYVEYMKKYNTLSTVDVETPFTNDLINIVLPERGSSIYFVSLLKSIAAEKNVTITNIKIGSEINSEDYNKSQVSFDIEGDENSVIGLLESLEKTLPVSRLIKIKSVSFSNIVRSSIGISVYSAQFPKTIPALSSPLLNLSPQENQTLKEFGSYRIPLLFGDVSSEEKSVKSNPFEIQF